MFYHLYADYINIMFFCNTTHPKQIKKMRQLILVFLTYIKFIFLESVPVSIKIPDLLTTAIMTYFKPH